MLTDIAGLSFRVHPGGTAPAALMAPIANAVYAANGVDELTTVADLEHWLGHATVGFDPTQDVALVEVDGALVAYGWVDWVDTTEGTREFRVVGYVHPEWQRRGIGRRLLAWQEEHSRAHPATATERPLVFGTWSSDQNVRKVRLFTRAGYDVARHFFEMNRPTLDNIEVPPMPDGLEILPVGSDRASQKQLWDADVEAFQDHWGGFDASDAAFEAWLTQPFRSPDLWVVAWDGDEIAGGVVNEINEVENAAFNRKRGWLQSVFVRRPWRRRGLGQAVVLRSLQVFRDRGMTSAGLGVDADNPTGALGLYERTGFEVEMRSTAYRKPLAVA